MKELENQFREVLEEGRKIEAEERRLDNMEADARAELVAVTDGDIGTPSAQKRIADARLALDMVAARRARLRAPRGDVWKRLEQQFKADAGKWNATVSVARDQEFEAFISANLPFFDNDERACRRQLGYHEFEGLPVAQKWRRAEWHMPHYPDPTKQDLVNDAGTLLRHIERHTKALGDKLEVSDPLALLTKGFVRS